jgi:2-oxoglutarate ferredoxin oxidoreductase subunit beta
MSTLQEYRGEHPAWCPGCGNFSILKAFKDAMIDLNIEPHQFTIVSGIGQAAKFPHYTKCNTFNGLHGRALPVAAGMRLANHEHPVMVFTGDGDCYGEGGNHLIHNIRRNLNIKVFVHDNQIYGLTKGQASPTSMEGMKTKIQPFGVVSEQMSPLALAISLDCSFVARGFTGEMDHLRDLMKEAYNHKGFSLVDIMQPCVTFNKVNTFEWYRERAYIIDGDHDPQNRVKAFEKALEWGERIPLGVIYKNDRPLMEEQIPVILDKTLVKQRFELSKLETTLKEFY